VKFSHYRAAKEAAPGKDGFRQTETGMWGFFPGTG
jgi:hypothetical protein